MKQVTFHSSNEWYWFDDGNTLWNHDNAVVQEVCDITYAILTQCRDSECKEDQAHFSKYVSKILNG